MTSAYLSAPAYDLLSVVVVALGTDARADEGGVDGELARDWADGGVTERVTKPWRGD